MTLLQERPLSIICDAKHLGANGVALTITTTGITLFSLVLFKLFGCIVSNTSATLAVGSALVFLEAPCYCVTGKEEDRISPSASVGSIDSC